MDLKGGDHGPS